MSAYDRPRFILHFPGWAKNTRITCVRYLLIIHYYVFFIVHAKMRKELQIVESSVKKMKALGVNVYVIWHEEPNRRKVAGDKGEAIKK